MEKVPTRTPIKVEDVVLRTSEKPRYDPNSGKEISNEFVAVIFTTIEQQFTSSGKPSTKKRTVSEPQGNLTLREAKEAYPKGMTFSSDELILVKLQENETREWNHYDSQTGEEVSDTIDHSYAVVDPALYARQKNRQQALRQRLRGNRSASHPAEEIGEESVESQVFNDKTPRSKDLQPQT